MTTKRYLSDTHLLHDNIIHHCARPFRSTREMDEALVLAMLEAEEDGAHLYHLGDLTSKPEAAVALYGGLYHPERHTLIAGNHDRVGSPRLEARAAYSAYAGSIVGTEATWQENVLLVEDELDGRPVRLLLSHAPQPDPRGADLNLYGHCHNNNLRYPERFAAEYP